MPRLEIALKGLFATPVAAVEVPDAPKLNAAPRPRISIAFTLGLPAAAA